MKEKKRDIEKGYPKKVFIAKLRRLAGALENDRQFSIQIDGDRVHVPMSAKISIEHERGVEEEEIEFQIKWKCDKIFISRGAEIPWKSHP